MMLLFVVFVAAAANPFGGGGMFGGGSFDGGFGPMMGGGFMRPSFLQNLNATALQAWDSIMQGNKTLAQIEQEQLNFGAQYGVTPQIQQWQGNMTQLQNELSQNISTVISALPQLKDQFMNVLNDKTQTPQALAQNIMNLTMNSGTNGIALISIAKLFFKPGMAGGMGGQMGMGMGGQGFAGSSSMGGFPGITGGLGNVGGGFPAAGGQQFPGLMGTAQQGGPLFPQQQSLMFGQGPQGSQFQG